MAETVVPLENPYAGQGAVLLDIGGNVGALMVDLQADMAGVEVGILPTGTPRERHHVHGHSHDQDLNQDHGHSHDDHDHAHHQPHVAVVARPTAVGVRHSLVYPELVEGTYDLFVMPDGPVTLTVAVAGGAISSVSWPS